jgi:hypothetical protein
MNKTTLTKKFLSWERLLKKEESYLWKKLRDEADKVFSIRIRKRDKKKWCITSQAQWCKKIVQHNCHWIDRAWYSHRWSEENCYWWCASCNTYHEAEHKIHFTNFMIKKHWQERVDEQLRIRNKKKPTIQELLDLINKYN